PDEGGFILLFFPTITRGANVCNRKGEDFRGRTRVTFSPAQSSRSMEVLETLAVALGFATLAGLNLYLVVLVSGLAIQQGWVDVSTTYPDLMVLGDPLVVTPAGIFFCLEFFSDKIPWVDSLWDTVHTLIRPVRGGLLALQTLGPTDPGFE